ncbi:hypothetical protein SLS55_008735 [Diplodia seriata]|uniref:Potassium transporter n=1 Tax=Diplodia seriata TaxID=420778 RepID=A0ABR3C990_9PEZI
MEDEFGDLKHLSLFQAGSGQATRLKHRNSVKQLREKDADLVYDEEDTIDYRPQERDFKHEQVFKGWTLIWLAYQSTGVIYGDLGTSPLYVFSSTFSEPPSKDDLVGALSLIIWAITLIVTVKYILIVLSANDEGEGGTFAVYSLLSRYCNITKHDPTRWHTHRLSRFESNELRPLNQRVRDFLEHSRAMHFALKALSVFGVSLILADTILTPAQSVLGAVQGLRVVRPDLGTDLVVGVEALFADLGAFSQRAIQISWIGFAYPCILMAYIGQAARISTNPSAYDNPFFESVPPGMFYPSLIISILAAVVASQAMITSAFQLLSQVMNTSYFPQIQMIYTSNKFYGQVFIPMANWLLMIGTVIVTAVYNNTTKLGHAYGFCVVLVTFITTNLVALVAIIVWRLPWFLVLPVWAVFLTLDGLFLASAATKFVDGAWFTFVLACILALVFIVWRYGKEQQWRAEDKNRLGLRDLIVRSDDAPPRLADKYGGGEIYRIKGLGIFFDKAGDKVPIVYEEFLKKFEAQQDVHVFLHLRALHIPHVKEEERYEIAGTRMPNCYRMIIRHGYNDHPINADLGQVVYSQLRHAIVKASRPKNIRNKSPPPESKESTSGSSTVGAEPAEQSSPENPDAISAAPRNSTNTRTTSHRPQSASTVSAREPAESPDNSDDDDRISLAASTPPSPPTPPPGARRRRGSVSKNLRFADQDHATYANLPEQAVSRRLAALDKAFATQVVYVVGKEQLRLLTYKNGSMKRILLSIFLWLRENTRTKVSKMNIPVEKLVEVGFVREI